MVCGPRLEPRTSCRNAIHLTLRFGSTCSDSVLLEYDTVDWLIITDISDKPVACSSRRSFEMLVQFTNKQHAWNLSVQPLWEPHILRGSSIVCSHFVVRLIGDCLCMGAVFCQCVVHLTYWQLHHHMAAINAIIVRNIMWINLHCSWFLKYFVVVVYVLS